MLQHIDDQKLEEIFAGISGLHGPDAREILKHNAIQWKYIAILVYMRGYNVIHSPRYEEMQRLCM